MSIAQELEFPHFVICVGKTLYMRMRTHSQQIENKRQATIGEGIGTLLQKQENQ